MVASAAKTLYFMPCKKRARIETSFSKEKLTSSRDQWGWGVGMGDLSNIFNNKDKQKQTNKTTGGGKIDKFQDPALLTNCDLT